MNDWREGLQHASKSVYKPIITEQQPHLCNCKAGMKGKWVQGVYMCIRCDKRVYDAFS